MGQRGGGYEKTGQACNESSSANGDHDSIQVLDLLAIHSVRSE